MTLASVADIRGARRVSPVWQATPNPQVAAGTFRFMTLEAGVTITTPSTSAGESPTSHDGVDALPAGGVITRVDSDFGGIRTWVALFDLIWTSQVIDAGVTGVTAIGSSTFPARDVDGSSNGRGLVLAAYSFDATATFTVSYTNSAGTAGRSATSAQTLRKSISVIPLDSGDQGIRSIESVNITTAPANQMQLLVLRPVGRFLTDPRRPGDRASAALERLNPGTMLFATYAAQVTTNARGSYIRTDIALG